MSFLFDNFAFLYDRFMQRTGLAGEERIIKYCGDVKGKKAADIGGGTGSLAKLLFGLGAAVTVIDPSKPMTDIAKDKDEGINVINARGEHLPIGACEYGIVTMKDCLHHMTNQEKALKEAVRILKPGGKMVILEFEPAHRIGKLIYILERLAFEKTRLVKPAALVEVLQNYGVKGRVEYLNSLEYVFVGYKYGEDAAIL